VPASGSRGRERERVRGRDAKGGKRVASRLHTLTPGGLRDGQLLHSIPSLCPTAPWLLSGLQGAIQMRMFFVPSAVGHRGTCLGKARYCEHSHFKRHFSFTESHTYTPEPDRTIPIPGELGARGFLSSEPCPDVHSSLRPAPLLTPPSGALSVGFAARISHVGATQAMRLRSSSI